MELLKKCDNFIIFESADTSPRKMFEGIVVDEDDGIVEMRWQICYTGYWQGKEANNKSKD